jgi:hypothetical protein
MLNDRKLDDPLLGVRAIGREAKIFTENGRVDVRKTYYALEKGYIDATKFGRRWISTPRRIRSAYVGGSK